MRATLMRKLTTTILIGLITYTPGLMAGYLEDFKNDGDIDAFCNAYESTHDGQCKVEISQEEIDGLLYVIKENPKEIINYLREHILAQDATLDMDPILCLTFKNKLSEVADIDIIKLLEEELNDYGYSLKSNKLRSAAAIKRKATHIRSSSSCNLKLLAENYGEVTKSVFSRLRGVTSRIKIPGPIPKGVSESLKDYIYGVKPLDKLDREIEKEKRAKLEQKERKDKEEREFRALESKCYIDESPEHCLKLRRHWDEKVYSILGSTGIRIMRNSPATRDVVYTAARLKQSYDDFSLIGAFEQSTELVSAFVLMRPLSICILTFLAIYYRSEMSSIISILLASNGFSVLPMISIARSFLHITTQRIAGLIMALTITLTTAAYNASLIEKSSAIVASYLAIVIFMYVFQPVDKLPSPIWGFAPLICWITVESVVPMLSFSMFTTYKTESIIARFRPTYTWKDLGFLVQHENLELLPALAIMVAVAIYLLSYYCDTIGYAIYKDVANKMSRTKAVEGPVPKPTLTDYLAAFLNGNVAILLGCIALPGLFCPTTWMLSVSVAFSSMVMAALIYQFNFHDEYIREGQSTGSTADRIVDSMNIIVGMAPKNIILPRFQSFVTGSLVMMAFLTGYRLSFPAGVVLGVLVGITVYRRPTHLQLYISWFTGLVITLCGTVPHAIIGLLFLAFRVGRALKFHTDSMVPGEVVRDLTLH